MTMDMNVGHNLRKIRESLGLDIVDVSIETGYSESHLAQLERDKRRPSFDSVERILQGVPIIRIHSIKSLYGNAGRQPIKELKTVRTARQLMRLS